MVAIMHASRLRLRLRLQVWLWLRTMMVPPACGSTCVNMQVTGYTCISVSFNMHHAALHGRMVRPYRRVCVAVSKHDDAFCHQEERRGEESMRTQSKRGAGRASVGRFVLLPLEGTLSPAPSTRVLNSNLTLFWEGNLSSSWCGTCLLVLVYHH